MTNLYTIIPTRSIRTGRLLDNLAQYLDVFCAEIILSTGEPSIFDAYYQGLKSCESQYKLNDDDIFIMCHDDISILSESTYFVETLTQKLSKKDTGFVGVAGASLFGKDAVWWDRNAHMAGKLSGVVYHIHDKELQPSYYGPHKQVAVLDGLFLAATYKTLKSINLTKPKEFSGNWDFYDIYYTLQATQLGLKNYTLPIQILHESHGNLVGRDSWHLNRQAIQQMFKLPIEVS